MAINCDRAHRNFACIYMITYKKDGRRYIGQTINLQRRLNDYREAFRKTTGKQNQPWIRYLQRCYDVRDFDKEFDVDILEYIDEELDQEQLRAKLNELEIKYIKEYGTVDKEFKTGFNYVSGGSGMHPRSDNVLHQTRNRKDVNRASCFIYDIDTNSISMYATLQSAADDLSLKHVTVRDIYYTKNIYNKRYKAFPINASDRHDLVSRLTNETLKRFPIYKKRKNSANIVSNGVSLMNYLLVSLLAEMQIVKSYDYDTNTNAEGLKYVNWLMETIGEVREMITTYGKETYSIISVPEEIEYILYAGIGKDPYASDKLLVYDTCDDVLLRFNDLSSAATSMGVKKHGAIEGLKHGRKVNKRYFVYYADKKLCEATVEIARTDFRPKNSKEGSDRYQYLSIYHKIFPITL